MKNLIAQLVVCLAMLTAIQINGLAAGVIDQTFGVNGTVAIAVGANAQAKKIKIQPDGKILALGAVGSGGAQETVLARYHTDGSPDASFGTNGIVVQSFSPLAEDVNDLALQADGKIVVAGNFYSPVTGSIDFLVARFNQNGSLDTSFDGDGLATVNQGSTDTFYAVAVQPDGKIVAAGRTSDADRAAVLRFNENGTLDSGFANSGLFYFTLSPFSLDDVFSAVAIYPNGRILIGGTAWNNFGTDMLVVLQPNGTQYPGFGTNGVRIDSSDTSPESRIELAILPNGRILAVSRLALRRYLNDGASDQTFRALYTNGGFDTTAAGTDFVMRSDGKIIVLNQRTGSIYHTVVYDDDGRDISRIKNFRGADMAIQSDDKFIVLDAAGDSLVLKRFISISSPGTRIADFDYDEKTDLVVLQNSLTVRVLNSRQSPLTYQLSRYPGDDVRIMPEDYPTAPFVLNYWRLTGQAQNRPAYFESVNENGNIQSSFEWGMAGDIPIGGDFDGETQFNLFPSFRKTSEYGIFRPADGDWWLYNRSTNAVRTFHWGANGDRPVPADYDYDGITDYAVYRPSTGTWWVHRSSNDSYFTLQFGNASDTPLVGDYDGDGRADFTVYRASEGNWYQFLTTGGYRVVRFGLPTDFPVPGDYDGDGRHDIAVFREGVWYLLQSRDGFRAVQWGNPTDVPVTVRYDR